MNTLQPRWNTPPAPLRHTWNGMGNIDQFRWMARKDLLDQLALARDEIGLRHVRAVSMYSPELRVWAPALPEWRVPENEKSPQANWQLVDLSLEALVDLGLKPIYTTCFTPQGFSDDPTNCWPDKNPTGMPRDLAQWEDFVSSGIRHHIARFGHEEVSSWYFECWNEPNLKGCFFGGDKEDFFRLWSSTWRAVKSVDPAFRFGGPSTARAEWIPEFLDWAEKDGTPPDYLVAHVYNNDSDANPLSPFDGPASHKVKDSPHFATGVIRGLRRELDARGWKGEVHWNEWGRSWFPHDPAKESPLEAAFIVKTMAEVSQDGDYFGFWCLSDIYDQIGFQSSEFQGHYGMLSLHGLRKPSWFAHVLLGMLGTSQVPVDGGDDLTGALATVDGGRKCILVHAYPEHHDAVAVTEEFRVALTPGASSVKLYRIISAENNITATWRAMGSPTYPTRAQLGQLRSANTLTPAAADAGRIVDGHAVFNLERPGVALLEII